MNRSQATRVSIPRRAPSASNTASRTTIESLEDRLLMATFTVVNTLDGPGVGPLGSLRRAIVNANFNVGADTIDFNIPGPPGVKTIAPTSPLPALTGPTIIDGQSGGAPGIEINGSLAGAGADGLTIAGDNSRVINLIINRFRRDGIVVTGNSNSIGGNFVGVDSTGNVDRGNGRFGVRIDGSNNALLGRNVISGNGASGVALIDPNGNDNKITTNRIGVNAAATAAIPNDDNGIVIRGSSRNQIGLAAAPVASGNLIAFNGRDGISMISGIGNAVYGNAIFSNGGLGIDLGDDGVTPNDNDDPDNGANQLQNTPVLTSAVATATGVTVSGTINSTANTDLLLQFYASLAPDPTGSGEGLRFLGSSLVTTNAGGNAGFSVPLPAAPVGSFISATATRVSNDSTSEFSRVRQVTGPASNAPHVTAVFAGSTRWNSNFRDLLTINEQGSDLGLLLPAVQTGPLSWTNLNEISVRFDRPVVVHENDLKVADVSGQAYPVDGFDYDELTMTATWTLTRALRNDRVRLVVDSGPNGVRSEAGVPLDGEFNAAFPSGDGSPGGNFQHTLLVLPGDVDRSGGAVNASDLVRVRNQVGLSAAAPGKAPDLYSPFIDVNGDGVVNAADLVLTRNRIGTTVPRPPDLFSAARIGGSAVDSLHDDGSL